MPGPLRNRRLMGNPYPQVSAHFTAASTQYLSINDNASLSMGAGVRMTIAFWAWFDTLGSNRVLIAKGIVGGAANQMEYSVYGGSDNMFHLRVSDNTTLFTVNSGTFGTFAANAWYFVVAKYDGANISISVNNGAFDNVAFTTDIFDGANAFRLGAGSTATLPHDGRIDAVGLWKVVLTAAQITALYRSGVGVAFRDLSADLKTSLSGWWDLDGTFNDASGSANHLAQTGGVTFTAGKR